MSNLFLTLLIAFVIIVFAIALLAIGWLITGKTKIERVCGLDSTKKKDESCQTACDCSSAQDRSSDVSEDSKNNTPS